MNSTSMPTAQQIRQSGELREDMMKLVTDVNDLINAVPGIYDALGASGAKPAALKPLGPLAAWLSRRHEYAADAYAARHTGPSALRSALVKLYRDNATTLTPDPVYAGFHASHPPARPLRTGCR